MCNQYQQKKHKLKFFAIQIYGHMQHNINAHFSPKNFTDKNPHLEHMTK